MKKIFVILLPFVFLVNLSAQNNLRFDLDLEDLVNLNEIEKNELISGNDQIIIDGLLSSVAHEDNAIYLSIMNGKWIGTSRIEMYEARIRLDRNQWGQYFPERMPRNPDSSIIRVNTYLLILGQLRSIDEEDGTIVVYIDGEMLRRINQN